MQFIKVQRTANVPLNVHKMWFSIRQERDLFAKIRKYRINPEKKRQAVKKRYHDEKNYKAVIKRELSGK